GGVQGGAAGGGGRGGAEGVVGGPAVTVVLAAVVVARRLGYLGIGVASLHNALVEPGEVLNDGVPIDTVAPNATERLRLPRGSKGGLAWRLLRPGNPAIGEPLEGPLPMLPRRGGRWLAAVGAE